MRVIYTAGVWDLFHAGHLRFLRASKALGDVLVVGVLTDDGAAAYKRRPVQHEHERLELVQSIGFVDAAFLQPGTDPTSVIMALNGIGKRPDVMTHGDDWTELREGNETLRALGVELALLPYGNGTGTTGIIERIRAGALNGG